MTSETLRMIDESNSEWREKAFGSGNKSGWLLLVAVVMGVIGLIQYISIFVITSNATPANPLGEQQVDRLFRLAFNMISFLASAGILTAGHFITLRLDKAEKSTRFVSATLYRTVMVLFIASYFFGFVAYGLSTSDTDFENLLNAMISFAFFVLGSFFAVTLANIESS